MYALILCILSGATPSDFLLGADKGFGLSYYETSTSTPRSLFQGKRVDGYRGALRESAPRISPQRKYAAFLTENPDESKDNQELHVVDLQGTPVFARDNVYTFSWSPTDNAIVYIAGKRFERSTAVTSRQVFLRDLQKNKEEVIAQGVETVYWAQYDGQIYLRYSQANSTVYNPDTRSTTRCPYHDVFFSPDGRYYFTLPDSPPSRIYSRATNTDVTDEFLPTAASQMVGGIRWLGPDHLLLFRTAGGEGEQRSRIVLGLAEHKVRRVTNYILTIVEGTYDLVLSRLPEGGFTVVPLDSLPIVSETEEGEAAKPTGK